MDSQADHYKLLLESMLFPVTAQQQLLPWPGSQQWAWQLLLQSGLLLPSQEAATQPTLAKRGGKVRV